MSEEQLDPQETPQETPKFTEEKPVQNPFPPQNGGFNTGFNGGFSGMQQALPNATAVLVMGILSIVTCCCFYGIIGVILGVIAVVLSKKDRDLYFSHPNVYTESSFKNSNAGRVCGIIGLILSGLIILICIVFVAMFGFAGLSDQQHIIETLKGLR